MLDWFLFIFYTWWLGVWYFQNWRDGKNLKHANIQQNLNKNILPKLKTKYGPSKLVVLWLRTLGCLGCVVKILKDHNFIVFLVMFNLMWIFRHRRNPASKFINDEYVVLSKDHYLEMLYQMQSIAIEHIKMKDMVGCTNHWSFQNSFYFTLALTTTVGSTIVPSTSEGIVVITEKRILLTRENCTISKAEV